MRGHFDLKVMTQNCASFKTGWSARALILAVRILLHRPDVLACTELYAARRGALTKRLKGYVFVGSYMGKVIYVRQGVKWHKGSLTRIGLTHGKHALAVRLWDPATGAWCVVAVAHLSWRIGHDTRREIESKRLDNAITARFGNTPAIYAGDFNSSIHKGKRKRDAVGEAFKARGLTEAYRAVAKRTHGTYNSANRYERPAPANAVHLDRIFGRGVEFLTWTLDYYVGRYGADHFGVIATVRIPTTKGTS